MTKHEKKIILIQEIEKLRHDYLGIMPLRGVYGTLEQLTTKAAALRNAVALKETDPKEAELWYRSIYTGVTPEQWRRMIAAPEVSQ